MIHTYTSYSLEIITIICFEQTKLAGMAQATFLKQVNELVLQDRKYNVFNYLQYYTNYTLLKFK